MESIGLTKKDKLREIIRCGKDPAYFINNYVYITHPVHGKMLFKTFDFQEALVRDLVAHRYNIVLKARQIGASTIVQAYCLWLILFHQDKEILVLNITSAKSSKFVKKSKRMYELLPSWLKIAKDTVNNRTSLELTNGSLMWAGSSAADAGRSDALSLLVIDEAAIIEGMDEIWTSAKPTISTGGRCIALSTPFGSGDNWFYKTYSAGEDDLNDFHATKLMWNVRLDRGPDWLEQETRGWDKRKIAQEFLCDFLASGMTVIEPEIIFELEKKFVREPKERLAHDRNYYVWERPKPSVPYLITADVARGDGQDYSTFIVFRTDTMEQVAEYKGKLDSDVFAPLLSSVGSEYGSCMIVVENNTYGFSVLERLIEKEYPNVFFHRKGSHEHVEPLLAYHRDDCSPGFAMTMKTRPQVIAKMEELIRNRVVTIRSKRLIKEMRTFIWKNGRPEAQKGANDDLIIPLAIACWVRETALIKNQRDIDSKKALINAMFCSVTKINTSISGMTSYRREEDPYEEKEHPEKKFFWLF